MSCLKVLHKGWRGEVKVPFTKESRLSELSALASDGTFRYFAFQCLLSDIFR